MNPVAIIKVFESHESNNEKLFFWTKNQILDALNNCEIEYIEERGDLRAFMLYRKIGDSVLEVDLIMTHGEHLKKGFAKALLDKFCMSLKEGIEVWLEVHENNLSAINLYEKMGFKQVGKRPKYYADGASALLLSKKI